jgi:hypothetical protein
MSVSDAESFTKVEVAGLRIVVVVVVVVVVVMERWIVWAS